MKNNIVLRSNQKSNLVAPDFKENENADAEVRRIKIVCETGTKKDGGTFKKVYGLVVMDTYSTKDFENYTALGLQVHKLRIGFQKKAFDKAKNVRSIESLQGGYLYVFEELAHIPTTYKLRYKKDKNGNYILNDKGEKIVKFPEIWLDDYSIIGLEKFRVSQDALDVDAFNAKNQDVIDAEPIDEVSEELEEVK